MPYNPNPILLNLSKNNNFQIDKSIFEIKSNI